MVQASKDEAIMNIHDLYKQSIVESGVHLVPGGQLTWYQNLGNSVQRNPFNAFGAVSIPAAGYVLYSQKVWKPHPLEPEMNLLHGRVLAQAAVVGTAFSVMTVKTLMDYGGEYVTESQLEDRVQEMMEARENLVKRLQQD